MQWSFDGQPTWHATDAVWLRSLLQFWVLSTEAPFDLHGAEIGLMLFSIIFAVSHVLVVETACRQLELRLYFPLLVKRCHGRKARRMSALSRLFEEGRPRPRRPQWQL